MSNIDENITNKVPDAERTNTFWYSVPLYLFVSRYAKT